MNNLARIALAASCLLGSHCIAAEEKKSRTQVILEKACKDLVFEQEKLSKQGKSDEVAEVQRVLDVLSQITPQNVPQFCVDRMGKELVGRWVSFGTTNTFEIDASGSIKRIGDLRPRDRRKGIVAPAQDATHAVVTWEDEEEWRIYRVDKDRIAIEVDDKQDINKPDGAVLNRLKQDAK